jgi:hypothetical protein
MFHSIVPRSAAHVAYGAFAIVLSAACGGPAATSVSGPPDTPVDAAEPRAVVDAVLDLPASANCEGDFDEGMYPERGIILIAWGEKTPKCLGRQVAITYRSRSLSETALLDIVRAHARVVSSKRRP